ncbi:hypothetical protein [Streptomyces melanogenes]|uniref:hypothetical protein n=1 Tax=Streptomyces melanogenes TaxID=67326 RepID=UPI0037A47B06
MDQQQLLGHAVLGFMPVVVGAVQGEVAQGGELDLDVGGRGPITNPSVALCGLAR